MVNNRAYFIFEDVLRDKTLRQYFKTCIKEIQNGTARLSKTRAKAGYTSYPCFRIEGKELLVGAVLEYYLFELQCSGFVSSHAEEFTDKMRTLCGWHWDVDRILRKWIDKTIRNPFFYDANNSEYEHKWVLNPEAICEENIQNLPKKLVTLYNKSSVGN